MPKYQTTRIVPYTQDEIFNIMMDIEKYPDILPFIQKITIKNKTDSTIDANVTVGVPPIAFSYDCEITGTPYEIIEITTTKEPFKNLYAKWSFKALSDNKTQVTCFLDSEFKSQSMELIGGRMFAYKFQQTIAIFESYLKRSNRKRPD